LAPDETNARLMRWGGGHPLAEDAYSRVLADPNFGRAARALVGGMAELSDADRALDGVFKDAGRYVAALWAMYLHATDGITLPRLKAVCAASRLLSPGRARAMLIYLQHLGYLAPDPVAAVRPPVRYHPTPAFLDAWRLHLRAALDAAAVLEPGAARVSEALAQPGVLEVFCAHHARGLLESVRAADQSAHYMAVFMHRHAGNQIAQTLILDDHGGDFPSTRPVAVNAGALARRFGVSRIHVRRLFEAAEREGVLVVSPDGVCFSEDARRFVRFNYASQFVQLLTAAAATLAAVSPALAESA